MTKISFDLDDSDLTKLQKEADANERTVAAQIRYIIKEHCKK